MLSKNVMTKLLTTHPTKINMICPPSALFNRQANIPYFPKSIALIWDFTKAWAQATRVDGSLVVLHSGNHEFIGIRHRSTQTLYISDLIKPHACKEPSYGKLHVGIYIAAIKDAIDRESQEHDARPPGSGSMKSKESGGGMKPKEGGNQGGITVRSAAKKRAMAAHEVAAKEVCSIWCCDIYDAPNHACQSTLELVGSRNVILLYLQYDIYDSSAPSTFVRSGPTGQAPIPLPSQETVRNYQLEECLTIVLKSEIGRGATGEVLRGTLEVEASACVLLDVAVKLALTSEQRDALRSEYNIYHRLRLSGVTAGIITPLGLFDDVEGGACALVMPYVGIPLTAVPELVLPISYQCVAILCHSYHTFWHWDREAALATLAKMHDADVLHGDLRLDNILLADSGLTIIDFGRSRECDDKDAKNSEYSQLQSLLNRRAN
jgi:hypothetical protein